MRTPEKGTGGLGAIALTDRQRLTRTDDLCLDDARTIWRSHQDLNSLIFFSVCVPLAACPPVQWQNTGDVGQLHSRIVSRQYQMSDHESLTQLISFYFLIVLTDSRLYFTEKQYCKSEVSSRSLILLGHVSADRADRRIKKSRSFSGLLGLGV